jgi:hypothetical protein
MLSTIAVLREWHDRQYATQFARSSGSPPRRMDRM